MNAYLLLHFQEEPDRRGTLSFEVIPQDRVPCPSVISLPSIMKDAPAAPKNSPAATRRQRAPSERDQRQSDRRQQIQFDANASDENLRLMIVSVLKVCDKVRPYMMAG